MRKSGFGKETIAEKNSYIDRRQIDRQMGSNLCSIKREDSNKNLQNIESLF